MSRNGLGSLVVVNQLGLLDVQQSGQSLVGGTSHLVVTDGNGSGSLALSVLSGVLADLTIGIQVNQRSLGEQFQVGQRGQVLLMDNGGTLGLDADADAGAGVFSALW